MSSLLATGLLVLSLLFARPSSAWRPRLLWHSLLLVACLLTQAFGPAPLLPLVGSALVLGQAALLFRASPVTTMALPATHGASWMLAGLLTIWLAIRLAHDPVALPSEHGLLAVALGVVLTGLLGASASHDRPARAASLLLAGNGALLAACAVPGPGWSGLACVAALQLWVLTSMLAEPASATR